MKISTEVITSLFCPSNFPELWSKYVYVSYLTDTSWHGKINGRLKQNVQACTYEESEPVEDTLCSEHSHSRAAEHLTRCSTELRHRPVSNKGAAIESLRWEWQRRQSFSKSNRPGDDFVQVMSLECPTRMIQD